VPTNRKRDLGSKKLPRKAIGRDNRTLLSWPPALPSRFTLALMQGRNLVQLDYNKYFIKLFPPEFTPEWEKVWEKVAGAKRYKLSDGSFHNTLFESFRYTPFSEHVPDKRKVIETYEYILGALKHFREFKNRNGFAHLKALSDRGVGVVPNFILSLFIFYLWEDRFPLEEHKDWQSRYLIELKSTLRRTRQFYKSMRDGFPKEDIQGFERVLSILEKEIEERIEEKDFSTARRGSPRDKENRVIFALHEHIKQATGSPQWGIFFDLLLSARTITTGKKKRKAGHENDPESQGPDSRIRTRINSFKRNHPKETQAIKEYITPTILEFIPPRQSN